MQIELDDDDAKLLIEVLGRYRAAIQARGMDPGHVTADCFVQSLIRREHETTDADWHKMWRFHSTGPRH